MQVKVPLILNCYISSLYVCQKYMDSKINGFNDYKFE